MTQLYKDFLKKIFLLVLSTLMLNGCGNNASNVGGDSSGATAYFNAVKAPLNENDLELNWQFDGYVIYNGFVVNDILWHLVTITVINQITPLATPIAIKGLQWEIYPKPTDNRGESVEIEDINCNTAMFSKNGDTCSAYVRAYYNLATGTSNPPVIPIQLATNAYDIGEVNMLNYTERALFTFPSGDYRAVLPIETHYYTGSAVKSNPAQYSILDMRNLANPPLTITTLSTTTNPALTLMNRQSAESNDPYYGAYNQCSLTPNASLKQVNYLESVASECILVYQAASTATTTIESTPISLITNAGTVSPWTASKLNLTARYVTGTPIQPNTENGSSFQVVSGSAYVNGAGMTMTTDGVLSSGTIIPSSDPFNSVNITYTFTPVLMSYPPYGIPYYENGVINVADQNNGADPIYNGTQILTNASSTNPVTVGTVTEQIAGGTAGPSSLTVNACGGAWASSTAQIVPGSTSLAYSNMVHLIMDNNNNSSCGGANPQHFEADIPTSGYNYTVFSNDEQGCGGNQWDMGAVISVSSLGCTGDLCTEQVNVTASHGGASGQCHDTETRYFDLSFYRSAVYTQLSNLQNFNLVNGNPSFVGRGGQTMSAAIGTQGGPVMQNIFCNNLGTCSVQGTYSNGLSSTSMSYNINLKAGDTLAGGVVDFTRSDGYDLSSFTSSQ